jgi:hypothetical protein
MKVGDSITVKYVSAYKKTQTGFVKITKIGHKYIYGVTLWVDKQEIIIKEGHPIKYDMNNIIIYPGIRRDLKEIIDKYDDNYRQWQLDRNKRDREIDWELKDFKFEKMDEWKRDNPMPQVPEFPKPN